MSSKQYINLLNSLNILYIEDEDNIRKNLSKTLNLLCNRVYDFSNVKDAFETFNHEHIDIILSDISMPNMTGLDFAEEIRRINKKIPIILLTAHTDTQYLLQATKLKLIDYLVKPLNFNQLKEALIKASIEIYEEGEYNIYFEDGIYYNFTNKKLFKKNEEINLTGKELALLEFLCKNKDKVVSTLEIKNYVWDDCFEATDAALKAVLNKLRHKIGKNSIKNISGVGYKIVVS